MKTYSQGLLSYSFIKTYSEGLLFVWNWSVFWIKNVDEEDEEMVDPLEVQSTHAPESLWPVNDSIKLKEL